MNVFSFTAFILILILVVGGYLLLNEQVSGTMKMILIVFLLVLGLYFLFNISWFKSYYEITDIPLDASKPYIYSAEKFSSIDQLYTLSTWIYIDDWNTNFGVDKNILHFERRGTKPTVMNLDKFENNLIIKYDVHKADLTTTDTKTIKIPNINIQKWVCITACFNTNNTDTYINGKLIDTDIHTYPIYKPATNVNNTNKGALTLAKNDTNLKGFSGKIGLTRYYGRVLSPQEVWNIYTQGPTTNLFGSLLNRYNASFIFYQDNKEVQKLSLM
jgi:hypothetical protein